MKVRFGDVVKEVKVNIDRAQNPYEFYVAGDHMDSEDFKIRRRGRFATDDVGPAFTRYFKPGQILYGSRRTYLKKVCVADFEGICANTTFVFESKDASKLDQRILPFLMLSDGFTKWSIQHSKGSTNPYVLFSDLADYEFDLPPIEKQRELAELLWAANDLKESYKKLIVASDEMLKAKFREMFGECGVQSAECGVRLGDEVVITTGKKDVNFGNENGAYPFFTCSREVAHCDSYSFDCEAILLAGNGDIGNIARYSGKFEAYQRTYVIKTRESGRINIDFLFHLLRLKWVDDTRRSMLGSTIPYIKLGMLADYKFPLPPLALQQEFVEIARKADETKAALKKSISDLDNVIKGLING